MINKIKKLVFILLIFILAIVLLLIYNRNTGGFKIPVKIGYFHGGRTMLIFRAYINGDFNKMKIPLGFYTKDLYGSNLYRIPAKYSQSINNFNFGKIRGGELIDEVVSGALDGATVGESSFIKAVNEGKPIVAVAMLGHDTKDRPAHAILIRSSLKINTPADLKGKSFVTRRAGDGDAAFFKEFLLQSGLDPYKDVVLKEQVDDNQWIDGLIEGKFDGGYYHEMAVVPLVESGNAYIFRKLDWVDPEMSQALLVFSEDFVKKNPDHINKILDVYMKRILYEKSLPKSARLESFNGMKMEDDFDGMNLPQYSYPPLVSENLLESMQDLLLKQKVIKQKVDLKNHIDNSFVESLIRSQTAGK